MAINIDYPNILTLIKENIVTGRTESASFLIWYLENYYRLDSQEAVDSVCDQSGDKGVDGIFVNNANGTIDIFQTKISQNPAKTVGDTALKEFYGTLSQFEDKDSIKNLIATGGAAQVVGLINRLGILQLFDQYKIRGLFISNVDLDANGDAYLVATPSIEFVGKTKLEATFISDTRAVPQNEKAEFDILGLNISKHFVDANTLAIIAPIKANELVKMPGISDQSVFAYNVRGPLGGTNVNRDIVRSVKDKTLHKKFPLFHNGITIVTNRIEETADKLKIETFFVVNGCQSLTALFTHRKDLTDDLRILTKFVQVSVDSDLSRVITQYSNNQNGVKPRDFKSNNSIQVRLQNEFKANYGLEYFYEIKRGEYPNNLQIISNELAGIHLMSFDLKEPWATHRKYQVFDEKYTDLFGKPEITAHRILMLHLIDQVLFSKLPSIKNQLVAKYALTRFAMLFMLRQIFENDETGKEVLLNPQKFILTSEDRKDFLESVSEIIDDIIVDFNGEVENLGADFDYKSKLRDDTWVKKVSQDVVSSYLKLVNRNRIDSFGADWKKRIEKR
jgi:AIPR protein